MTILLTGFEPFANLDVNPSQAIVNHIARRDKLRTPNKVVTEILPTEFGSAGNRIRTLIREVKPRAVVCVGMASGFQAVKLERVALNLDDTDLSDNAGEIPASQLIAPDGPVAYWSTLPLQFMREAIQKCGTPVTISNHAGTYVCNHVFYVARYEIDQIGSDTKCGLIHVPPMTEPVRVLNATVPGLPLILMVEAIECCLEILQEHITP